MGFGRKGKRRKRKIESTAVAVQADQDESTGKKTKWSNQEYQEYTPIEQRNVVMEAYYDYQGLHNTYLETSRSSSSSGFQSCKHSPDLQQKEKELFYSTVRKILPASFRIGQDCPEEFRKAIENQIQDYVVGISMENHGSSNTDESKFVGVEPIPYIPHAYQLNVDRRTIRRHPKLSEFHDWLKIITEAGFVTRQETVSMIPPIVLNVQPHHTVLDMCAAPGSKTSQLLEIITSSHNNNNNREPLGFVVANEVEEKRAYMLVHQLRRIQSPAIFITSCDAQSIPSVRDKDDVFLYDRVLADVPCSGDGTVRKNPGIWKKWSMFGPLGLHPVQVSIAKEAARLTKVGGYLVYSTCSLNPIENEAVVAELLRSCHGTLQLVDPRMQQLADYHDRMHLLARPGWTTWKVMSQKKPKRTKGKFTPKMIAKRELFAAATAASVQQDGNQKDHHQLLENEQHCNHSVTESKNVIIKNITGNDGLDHEESEIGDHDSTALDVQQGSIIQDDDITEDMPACEMENSNSEKNSGDYWDDEALRKQAIDVGLIPHNTFEDVPINERSRVRKSCFPPTEEEGAYMHLERCLRILPQDMNTGGFFVALLHKIAPTLEKKKNANRESSTTTSADSETGEKSTAGSSSACAGTSNETDIATKGTSNNRGKADLTTAKRISGNSDFVPVSGSIWPTISNFYGLVENFPKDQLMSRESGKAKVLYFITKSIKEKLIDNGIQQKTMVINSGLRAFERNNKDCEAEYRVTQEGIQYIAPYMTKRFLVANATDFCTCLHPGVTIWIGNFSSNLQAQLRDLSTGAFVVALSGFETDIAKKMFLVMWKCRGDALNCLVSKVEQLGITCKLRALGLLVEIPELKKPEKEQPLLEPVLDSSNADRHTSLDLDDVEGGG